MLNWESLRSLAKSQNGMVLDYGNQGFILLNSSGKKLQHLPLDGSFTSHELMARAKEFFGESTKGGQPSQKKGERIPRDNISFSLHLSFDILGKENCVCVIEQLCTALSNDHFVNIVFWCSCPPSLLEKQLDLFVSKIREISNVTVTLVGQFNKVSDTDKEFLFFNKVRLLYSVFRPTSELYDFSGLNDLCEFGFRVPALLFVSKENVLAIDKWIDYWMELNFNSGFALPLIVDAPCFFRDNTLPRNLPSAESYISLLADVFKKYPSYDDILYPLTSFASRSYRGNWSERFSLPRHVQMFARSDHGLFLCNQNFLQQKLWKTWDQCTLTKSGDVLDDLLKYCVNTFDIFTHNVCRLCEWKKLCGGQFQPTLERDDQEKQAFTCEVARFFLRSFLWQRCMVLQKDSELSASVVVQPISSAPKPQVSDATFGENSEAEQTGAKQSIDDLDEK